MSVHNSVFAFEFHGLLGAGDGVNGSTKNVAASVAVDIALELLHFDKLGLALKVIEQKDAGIFGKAQSRRNLGKMRFFEGALGVGFLVEGFGFGDGAGSALFLVLFGGRPVDERGRKFFPFVALGALVLELSGRPSERRRWRRSAK